MWDTAPRLLVCLGPLFSIFPSPGSPSLLNKLSIPISVIILSPKHNTFPSKDAFSQTYN